MSRFCVLVKWLSSPEACPGPLTSGKKLCCKHISEGEPQAGVKRNSQARDICEAWVPARPAVARLAQQLQRIPWVPGGLQASRPCRAHSHVALRTLGGMIVHRPGRAVSRGSQTVLVE